MYVSDTFNSTIRKITPAGVVSTLAGSAGEFDAIDGTGGNARFAYPIGVVTDLAGNVYVADRANETIRKITPAGVVSTLAGAAGMVGSTDSTDGTGKTARFYCPTAVATDSAGNVYVADTNNETIRKITPAGAVSTLAGVAGKFGTADSTDDTGSTARFNSPRGIATDSVGNVYVADTYNYTVRKITPAGVVSTMAGTPGKYGSSDGTGGAAQFGYNYGIATDTAGNVYVGDYGMSTIRKITPGGVVTTVVGSPESEGVHLGPLPGSINRPSGLAVLPGPEVTLIETDGENVILQIELP